MENKKSLMAQLVEEFGYGFDQMEPNDSEPVEEVAVVEETKKEQPKQEEQKDITIKCKKCDSEFIWSVKDQEFFKEKGFFRPSYCKSCRKKIKIVNNFHKEN